MFKYSAQAYILGQFKSVHSLLYIENLATYENVRMFASGGTRWVLGVISSAFAVMFARVIKLSTNGMAAFVWTYFQVHLAVRKLNRMSVRDINDTRGRVSLSHPGLRW